MERLTERYNDGQHKGILVKEAYGEDVLKTLYEKFGDRKDYFDCEEGYLAMEKLADYEDAEEQGLLLRMPCKVGDTVYHTAILPDKPKVIPFKISAIKILVSEDGKFKFDLYGDTFPSLRGDILGKRVFRTKEEAERALKQMGE